MITPEKGGSPEVAFRHLLVPLDGSQLAEAVLPAVIEIGRRCHSRVTLLHVLERNAPATVHGESHLGDEEAASSYLARLSERLTGKGLDVAFHVHPNLERDVAGSIVGHAAELAVDLVVLATHGGSDLRDVITGSIAEQVVGRGASPVLLIRPAPEGGEEPFVVRTLLVPLDGTPDSERALPLAEIMARAWGAEIMLLRVVPTTGSLSGEEAAVASMLPSVTRVVLEMEIEATAEYLNRLGGALIQRGITVAGTILRGDPAAMVLEAARGQGVDLVVMATHGRSGLNAFWAGSIGHRLAEHLTMPLIILRSSRS